MRLVAIRRCLTFAGFALRSTAPRTETLQNVGGMGGKDTEPKPAVTT